MESIEIVIHMIMKLIVIIDYTGFRNAQSGFG